MQKMFAGNGDGDEFNDQNTRCIRIICHAVFALWLPAMFVAFGYLVAMNTKLFDSSLNSAELNQAVLFEGEKAFDKLTDWADSNLANSAEPTLLHFWNPDCQCNRFNDPHLSEIVHDYQQQGVRFVVVTKDAQTLQQARTHYRGLPIDQFIPASDIRFEPSSSPAAVVMDASNQARYFGPYSVGAVCLAGDGFVETMLDDLNKGSARKQMNTIAMGCFCPWQ